jgi:hypothetical protein
MSTQLDYSPYHTRPDILAGLGWHGNTVYIMFFDIKHTSVLHFAHVLGVLGLIETSKNSFNLVSVPTVPVE